MNYERSRKRVGSVERNREMIDDAWRQVEEARQRAAEKSTLPYDAGRSPMQMDSADRNGPARRGVSLD